MIRAYKLDVELQDIFEDIRMYRADVETIEGEDHVTILRDEYEKYVRERLDRIGMGYREIVREGTTSFVFLLNESSEDALVEVKITLRFREGIFTNIEFKNFTFDRDFDFYLEQIEEEDNQGADVSGDVEVSGGSKSGETGAVGDEDV